MRLNRHRIPPGGWHYQVPDGPRLEAPTEEKLIKLIFEYRLRNGQSPGDPSADIDTYYCGRWPEACDKEVSDYPGDAP